jgi:hypothetical protein
VISRDDADLSDHGWVALCKKDILAARHLLYEAV